MVCFGLYCIKDFSSLFSGYLVTPAGAYFYQLHHFFILSDSPSNGCVYFFVNLLGLESHKLLKLFNPLFLFFASIVVNLYELNI